MVYDATTASAAAVPPTTTTTAAHHKNLNGCNASRNYPWLTGSEDFEVISPAGTASLLLCSERLMTEIPIERAFGAGICRIECKLRIASERRKREFLLRDTEKRSTEREND